MFQRLFGRERQSNRAITEALYERIVAAARQKVFYSHWNVPDTPLGRFEMLSLAMFLFQHRLRGETGAAAEVAQVLIDEFFTDVEHSLRELGISDVGVPKRMKKLARMFYGRTGAYADSIERGDRAALAAALARDDAHSDEASAMLAEVTPAIAALRDAMGEVARWIRPAERRGFLDRLLRGDDHEEYQPVGVIGLAAPRALPLLRAMGLLAGVLAAGNRVLVKLDAATPTFAALLQDLAPRYFDPLELDVLSGGEDAVFASLPFDRLVAAEGAGMRDGAATRHASKSLAVIGRSADSARAAERIVASKLVRSGRMPLAPDYVLVPAEQEEAIAAWIWRAAMRLHPRMAATTELDSPMSGVERDRLTSLIADARARGAEVLVAEQPGHRAPSGAPSMPLHIVRHASDDMLLMQAEIRGPILPLRNYARIEEAIAEIHRHGPPLAIHYYGRDAAERRLLLDRTISSAVAIGGPPPAMAQEVFSAIASEPASEGGDGEAAFRRASRTRRVYRRPILDLARLTGGGSPEITGAATPA